LAIPKNITKFEITFRQYISDIYSHSKPNQMDSWKDQFHFTRSERRGIIALSVLIVLTFFFPHVYIYFLPEEEPVDFTEFKAEVEAFYDSYEEPEKTKSYAYNSRNYYKSYDDYDDKYDNNYDRDYSSSNYKKKEKKTYTKPETRLFSFNPNTATYKELTTLGLSGKTANILINFREKGGKFYKKQDLKKVYGLKESDYERLENYIDIPAVPKKEKPTFEPKDEAPTPEEKPEIVYFAFDPNTATFGELMKLGLTKKVTNNIINYREKGGQFRQKEDLQKIYSLESEDYTRLEPYIEIAPPEIVENTDEEPIAQLIKNPKPRSAPVNININAATPEDWEKLYGIGPTYSKRIVKYRNSLGGFHAVNQVSEVYGLADSTFQSIRPQLQLDLAPIQQINLNAATQDELKKHPYLDWKRAKTIVAYRDNHGTFASVEDLKKVRAISSDLFEKLQPYLTVE